MMRWSGVGPALAVSSQAVIKDSAGFQRHFERKSSWHRGEVMPFPFRSADSTVYVAGAK
jgi:hypothetical protein